MDLRLRLPDGAGSAIRDAGVVARRRDLAGEGPDVALTSDRGPLQPGFWQITARPPAGYYLSDVKVDAPWNRRARRESNPDWFEFYLGVPIQVSISLSPNERSFPDM